MSTENWEQQYSETLNTPPEPGHVLRAMGGEDVKMCTELTEGRPPFVHAIAYVSNVFGQEIGWFLHPADSKYFHGWKVILLPKARQDYLKDKRPVKAIKIVRKSNSGKALLGEIVEYGDE